MDRSRSDVVDIALERERSLRFVQGFLGLMSIASVAAGIAVMRYRDDWGLPPESGLTVAIAFLSIGVLSTAIMMIWHRIFRGVVFD